MKTRYKAIIVACLILAFVMNIFDIIVDVRLGEEHNYRASMLTHLLLYGGSIFLLFLYYVFYHSQGIGRALFFYGLIVTEWFAPIFTLEMLFDNYDKLKIEYIRFFPATIAFALAFVCSQTIKNGLKKKEAVVIYSVMVIIDGVLLSCLNYILFKDFSTFFEGLGLIFIAFSVLIFALGNEIVVRPEGLVTSNVVVYNQPLNMNNRVNIPNNGYIAPNNNYSLQARGYNQYYNQPNVRAAQPGVNYVQPNQGMAKAYANPAQASQPMGAINNNPTVQAVNLNNNSPNSDAQLSKDDVSNKLAELKNMYDSGLISENDYNSKKDEIINKYFSL